MKTFDFVLKSGKVITVKCEHCTLRHIENELTGYDLKGLSDDDPYPMYIRISEIAAVVERGCNERSET